jgi:hypothetical protein
MNQLNKTPQSINSPFVSDSPATPLATRHSFRGFVMTGVLLVFTGPAVSQDFTSDKPNRDTADPATFLEDAQKYVIESPGDRVTLKLNEKSLLNWTNPVRQQERGALFVWMNDDRPLAIGSFFTYEYNAKVYTKHEFHSLSTKPIKSTFDGKLAWNPKVAGIEWGQTPNAPEPAKTHTARLLQMRDVSRRFRAELTNPMNERTELRLVSRPLLEYSSPKQHVIDGAIFSFTVATDPEVLLLVEAVEETVNGSVRSSYRHAFARFHYWNVAVFEGDTKVWEATLDRSHETNPIGKVENVGKIYNSYHPRP